MNIIDAHVHCKDENVDGVSGLERDLYHAGRSGVGVIFDMPDGNRPLISKNLVKERLALARDAFGGKVSYGLHVGLTSDSEQIREAIACCKEMSLRDDGIAGVVGLNLFTGGSVDNLSVSDLNKQRGVYDVLVKCGYDGVLVVHCVDDKTIMEEAWCPDIPISYSLVRPPESEMNPIMNNIRFAYNSGFNGTLHFSHLSIPRGIDYISNVRNNGLPNFNISCSVAIPHLFLNSVVMDKMGADGLILKTDPPLRTREFQVGLLNRLKSGMVEWVETDHKNCSVEEKLNEPYKSGIPGLSSWPKVISRLRAEGLSEEPVEMLTRKNILRVYDLPESIVGTGNVNENSKFESYKYGYEKFL